MRPDISVLIPARNERSRIAPTIQAIARARSTDARVEFVIVDDASTDGCIANLVSAVPRLLEEPKIDIRVCRLDQHSGNYRARNQAAALASADILFITDAPSSSSSPACTAAVLTQTTRAATTAPSATRPSTLRPALRLRI